MSPSGLRRDAAAYEAVGWNRAGQFVSWPLSPSVRIISMLPKATRGWLDRIMVGRRMPEVLYGPNVGAGAQNALHVTQIYFAGHSRKHVARRSINHIGIGGFWRDFHVCVSEHQTLSDRGVPAATLRQSHTDPESRIFIRSVLSAQLHYFRYPTRPLKSSTTNVRKISHFRNVRLGRTNVLVSPQLRIIETYVHWFILAKRTGRQVLTNTASLLPISPD
ncbi:hypothetical protein F4778DRAFT_34917 [Xylariomycetidae sp. FL2044]|nr:hypothetical protein F4778DRAFT_34917 [Xylariomycetidae sp. FL2044]